MKKVLHWLNDNIEEFLMLVFLGAMTLIMGIQVFSRYAPGMSLSWSEELVLFIYLLPFAWKYFYSAVLSGQTSPALGLPMYYVQAAPMTGFSLCAFRVLQRWVIEFQTVRGKE